ncbi:hypothetical protein FNYG_15052 [Fusarium nygamai]|uniref:Uncharacterized protein n=1 Tax=Gibberella nygamai TaxID=42673 RepID=A0A2K0UKS5_GIBNY|nr:hypothetical protein FNYG_15052 [Fusarium nygamai]
MAHPITQIILSAIPSLSSNTTSWPWCILTRDISGNAIATWLIAITFQSAYLVSIVIGAKKRRPTFVVDRNCTIALLEEAVAASSL